MPTRSPALPAKRLLVRLLLLLLLVAAIIILFYLVEQQQLQLPANDFTMYWSSAKLLVSGHNPYDPAGLAYYQRQATNQELDAILMYYPPWSMLWVAPFGLLNHDTSQVLWLLIQTAVVFYCANCLWLHIGGPARYRWIAWVAAFTFGPTFAALGYTGQITPLLLLGLTLLYINIDHPGKDWLGGIYVLLVAIKPQVYILFFVIFLVWMIHQQRWKLLISVISGTVIATLLTMLFDPQIIHHFLQNFSLNTPVAWATPTIGTYLRYYWGIESFTTQFIPAFVISLLSFYIWWKQRKSWDWQDSLPWILFLSPITAPYTWTYDFIPLLIPVLICFARGLPGISCPVALLMTGIYMVINGMYWFLHLHYSDFYFIWFAPVLFIWFIMVWKMSLRKIADITGQY